MDKSSHGAVDVADDAADVEVDGWTADEAVDMEADMVREVTSDLLMDAGPDVITDIGAGVEGPDCLSRSCGLSTWSSHWVAAPQTPLGGCG